MIRVMRSSAGKLAAAYTGLGLLALALFAAPLWYAWKVTIEDGRIEILQADAQRLTDVFRREGADGLVSYIQTRVRLRAAGERLLLLTDEKYQPLAGNLKAWPANLSAGPMPHTISVERHGQILQAEALGVVLPGDYHLLVARDVALLAPLERYFWYGLASAVAILSILGAIGGILVRRALLLRIHDIGQSMTGIIQGSLRERLPTHNRGDELNALSQTINAMLEQMEQLIHGIRNVSNAIAHDLRTPLAELRSRLEELSLTKPGAEVTFAEIDASVADVDRVIGIFNALLRLAEIDSGLRRSGFVSLDLAELASAAAEFYQPPAELKGVRLSFQTSPVAPVRGDSVLLAQALGNLIDNALKYTPEGGEISVSVQRHADERVEMTVSDTGPGIPAAEVPKVTERFYRGDVSRGTPGVGLGLSLVEAVARLHGSTLELENREPGLRARITLPPDPLGLARLSRLGAGAPAYESQAAVQD
jgi:signal transduction histidine kinase